MSFDVNWDIEKYREEHESEDHWDLRRKFMERWKNDYCEERLVCLARVFANIELLGCRYPTEAMQEVARLSHDVAKSYRNSRKDKLKRTFVSASDAAEDRAKGVKREGRVIVDAPPKKNAKIEFVRPGQIVDTPDDDKSDDDDTQNNTESLPSTDNVNNKIENNIPTVTDPNEYLKDMEKLKCLDVRNFNDRMFQTVFGRMVLLIRPWTSKLGNIQSSCQSCHLQLTSSYENGIFTLLINGELLARASGDSRMEAKNIVEILAWNRLKESAVSVMVKEQFIAQDDTRLTMSDVTGKREEFGTPVENSVASKKLFIAQDDTRLTMSDVTGKREEFGTPVENSVASKMMKLMGWKGGGLGADAQGIAEPIKPHLQMVNRAGLGSQSTDIRQLRRAAQNLMQRYIASDTLDLDLVFSNEFSKDERAALHQVAQRAGLASKSYGGDADRFLVVKKKLDPFSLVRAVIEKGGNTPKYQVFIPATLGHHGNRRR
ncbi:XRN-Two binding domain, XTBD domain-containing protein [Phthorimaea operculella]|nr:XRN-Two binding domain, XTBD domain-containing protein [Phthorimaea operculella]